MSCCGTCRHALPVDPLGHWRTRGDKYALSHIHCAKDEHPHVGVIPKVKPCQFNPSKWEAASV